MWLQFYSLLHIGQIPGSLFLITSLSLQTPIFHHIIPLLSSPVHSSIHSFFSSCSLNCYTMVVSFFLSLYPPNFAFPYQQILFLFLSKLSCKHSLYSPKYTHTQAFHFHFLPTIISENNLAMKLQLERHLHGFSSINVKKIQFPLNWNEGFSVCLIFCHFVEMIY